MGVNLKDLVTPREVTWTELSGKWIALDAFNALYQFLASIRQPDGTPLKDSRGRITSHLSGLFYRTINLLEKGVRPVYVFDGKPPEFKKKTREIREERKKEAEEKFRKALEMGRIEEAAMYARQALYLTPDMVEDSKRLLDAMGIPWVQAPSEGEAQASYMARKGDAWATGSQDYDSLLFGSPRLVRNLTITGKRKLPRKNVYVEIKPQILVLEEVLRELGIDRERLILLGILIGTDYNPGGVPGYGPKTALALVRKYRDPESILKVIKTKWSFDVEPEEIYEFFLNPPVTDDYEVKMGTPDKEKIFKILVDEHDFSPERVEHGYERLVKALKGGAQTSLSAFFK